MMKKIIMALCLACSMFLSACSDETEMTSSAVMFTLPQCEHCKVAVAYFEELKKEHADLTLDVRDLSDADNRVLLKQFARKYNIEGQKAMTPIIFTPKGYMFNWTDDSGKELQQLLNIR